MPHDLTMADIELCIAFAGTIGIKARVAYRQWQNEFLPGLLIWRGALFINPDHALGYDDILHELGHLAILPSIFRRHATGDVDRSIWRPAEKYRRTHPFMVDHQEDPVQRALVQADDSEVIAWGYAAQIHLGLILRHRFVMMDGNSLGWRQATGSEVAADLLALSRGNHFGVSGLQVAGMATTRTFPKMTRWVQP